MAAEATKGPRDRLISEAGSLTYRRGVGVGVEALCRAAGVSKRSMYQYFSTKYELIAASLQERAADYAAQLLPDPERITSPRERILHVFDTLSDLADAPDYHGCAFLSAQVEIKDSRNPAFQAAYQAKNLLLSFFYREAEGGCATDPEMLARQLMLVFDGAAVRAGIGADEIGGLATLTAATLLDASGLH